MERRAFLRLLGMGAAGAVVGAELDLERLLWVPKPIITVPACYGNTLVTPDWVTREALRILTNNLALFNPPARVVESFRRAGRHDADWYRTGDVVTIQQPKRFARYG